MQDLINRLNEATKAYDAGNPIMSDAEWDKLYFQLQKMENESGIILPDSPTHSIYYQNIRRFSIKNGFMFTQKTRFSHATKGVLRLFLQNLQKHARAVKKRLIFSNAYDIILLLVIKYISAQIKSLADMEDK